MFFLILALLFLVGCKNDQSNSSRFNSNKDNIVFNSDENSLEIGSYKLKVLSSCISDTIEGEEYRIATEQMLVFAENGIHKQTVKPNIKQDSSKKASIPNASIWRATSIITSVDTFFFVEATGDCEGNWCPQFIGYYSKKGDRLFEGYFTDIDDQLMKDFEEKNGIGKQNVENKKRVNLCD